MALLQQRPIDKDESVAQKALVLAEEDHLQDQWGQRIFSFQAQTKYIFGFAGHIVSVSSVHV